MSFLKKAFSILITVIIAMCLFSCSNAESIIDLTKGSVTCKSKYVEFSYPSDCLIENDGERAFSGGANATITGDMLTTSGSTIKGDIEMLTRMGRNI